MVVKNLGAKRLLAKFVFYRFLTIFALLTRVLLEHIKFIFPLKVSKFVKDS
jgi:hypothetical protein